MANLLGNCTPWDDILLIVHASALGALPFALPLRGRLEGNWSEEHFKGLVVDMDGEFGDRRWLLKGQGPSTHSSSTEGPRRNTRRLSGLVDGRDNVLGQNLRRPPKAVHVDLVDSTDLVILWQQQIPGSGECISRKSWCQPPLCNSSASIASNGRGCFDQVRFVCTIDQNRGMMERSWTCSPLGTNP